MRELALHDIGDTLLRMDTSALCYGRFDDVVWVAETGSTNDDLTSQARIAPDRPRVRVADLQTAGRGRRDRRWEMASGGGLLISFYVPWPDLHSAHLVSTALGVAAVDAISSLDRHIGLKWPNDLVTPSGSKVGGMLANTVSVEQAIDPASGHSKIGGVVAGLGCNLSWPPPEHVGLEHATSLDRLGPTKVDRWELAGALIERFDRELVALASLGATALHDRYRDRCLTLGSRVRVEASDGTSQTGLATDIDSSGALIMSDAGVQKLIDVGDVVHLHADAGDAG